MRATGTQSFNVHTSGATWTGGGVETRDMGFSGRTPWRCVCLSWNIVRLEQYLSRVWSRGGGRYYKVNV